jgi:hypothetical protein
MSTRNLLDQIKVNTPCSADWDAMIGNAQVRFCEHCNLSVHNLSHMTRKRAQHLVRVSKDRLCVRYYRGPDGTLLTGEIPQKLYSIGRRVSRVAAGAFGAALTLSSGGGVVAESSQRHSPFVAYDTARLESGEPLKVSSDSNPTLLGTVIDPNGAVIPNATVTLIDESGRERFATTSDNGEYQFQELASGVYKLLIQGPGFKAAEITQVVVQSGASTRMDATLEVGEITATVGMMAMVEPSEPLVKAALEDDLQVVEELLTPKNVNLRDKATNATALEYAVSNGNREMVQSLLRSGADVNSRNASGQTVLMMLGEEGTSDIVWDLIHAGGKVNLRDSDGDTALIEAAGSRNVSVLNALLQAGATIEAKNDAGQTALMLAASDGLLANLRALILAGADVNAADKEGKTPLTYARENNQSKIIKLLESSGAYEGVVVPANK